MTARHYDFIYTLKKLQLFCEVYFYCIFFQFLRQRAATTPNKVNILGFAEHNVNKGVFICVVMCDTRSSVVEWAKISVKMKFQTRIDFSFWWKSFSRKFFALFFSFLACYAAAATDLFTSNKCTDEHYGQKPKNYIAAPVNYTEYSCNFPNKISTLRH